MFANSFAIDCLFPYLLPHKYSEINDCKDLVSLMICCRCTKHLIEQKYMGIHEFKYFDTIGWIGLQGNDRENEEKKFDKIHRIMVDQNVTLRGRDVHPMPKYLRELSFCHGYSRPFAQVFKLNELTNLTKLTLGSRFNKSILPNTLPVSLQDLTFGSYYNKPLCPGALPCNLTKLTFHGLFDHPLASLTGSLLPRSLIELTLSNEFNQPIAPGTFGENLRKLTFGCQFNKPLMPGALPDNLSELIFSMSSKFNKAASPTDISIEPGTLPRNLKKIFFGS